MTKRTEKEAAQLIEIDQYEGGIIYKCLLCGDTVKANIYYKPDHKAMIKHTMMCKGGNEMEATNLIVSTEEQQEWRAIQLYDSEMIERLARRIKRCVPNGGRLNDDEALALAQIAISTDLNPFVGELYYIPGKGPHIGIEGLRRKASQQSTYSMAPSKIMTGEEITEHGLKEYDVGRVAELYRHDVLARAVEINKAAGEPVIPIEPIVGIGIWRKGDQIPKGKSPAWVASKRAEADALKKGFNIVMPIHENGEWLPIVEGEEVVEAEVIRRETAINGERRERGGTPMATDFEAVIAAYKSGERELPPWVAEIRQTVNEHPKASDPISSTNNGLIQQLKVSAARKVTEEQFGAFVQIILKHALEEATYGEAAILMNDVINGPDFEARVVDLLS